MTKLRHQQPSLWHPGLTKDIEDLWEPWMRLVDRLLEDEQLVDTIYEAQRERYRQSRKRGREQTPAEVSEDTDRRFSAAQAFSIITMATDA